MATDLKILLKATPLKETDKTDFLNRFDTLTDDQKIRLSELCWKMLSQKYHIQVKLATDKLMYEVATGKKEFNTQEIENIKKHFQHELAKQLESTESAGELEEVRRQLAQHQQLVGKSKGV